MDRDRGTIKKVSERDIDLTLVNLLDNHRTFLSWFCNQLGIGDCEISRIQHSVVRDGRESDIEAIVETDHKKIAILIENKIDAKLLPNQAEDYDKRGEEYTKKDCDEFEVVLTAPEKYIENFEDNKFEKKGYIATLCL